MSDTSEAESSTRDADRFAEVILSAIPASEERLSQYQAAQEQDPICAKVMLYCREGWQLTSTTSPSLIKALKGIFARHGIPEVLRSDNGPQFDSDDQSMSSLILPAVPDTHKAMAWLRDQSRLSRISSRRQMTPSSHFSSTEPVLSSGVGIAPQSC